MPVKWTFRFISAYGAPRLVSINLRCKANSCHRNARFESLGRGRRDEPKLISLHCRRRTVASGDAPSVIVELGQAVDGSRELRF